MLNVVKNLPIFKAKLLKIISNNNEEKLCNKYYIFDKYIKIY